MKTLQDVMDELSPEDRLKVEDRARELLGELQIESLARTMSDWLSHYSQDLDFKTIEDFLEEHGYVIMHVGEVNDTRRRS